jgi:hypothetical protein
MPLNQAQVIVCPECGNKRCPKASDHHNACTHSNEPGQPGSVYSTAPLAPVAWFDDDGKIQGRVSVEQLEQLCRNAVFQLNSHLTEGTGCPVSDGTGVVDSDAWFYELRDEGHTHLSNGYPVRASDFVPPSNIDRNAVLQAIARGFCYPATSRKTMDVELAEAIADEVMNLIQHRGR